MCQLNYYNYVYQKDTIEDNDRSLRIIDEIWVQVTCFISPDSDSKVCLNVTLILNYNFLI